MERKLAKGISRRDLHKAIVQIGPLVANGLCAAYEDMLVLLPVQNGLLRLIIFTPDKFGDPHLEVKAVFLPLYCLCSDLRLTYSIDILKATDLALKKPFSTWSLVDFPQLAEAINEQGLPFLKQALDAGEFAHIAKKVADYASLSTDEDIAMSLIMADQPHLGKLKLQWLSVVYRLQMESEKLKAIKPVIESIKRGQSKVELNKLIANNASILELEPLLDLQPYSNNR